MESKKQGGKRSFYNIVNPLIPEFQLKDILQVVVGASILAVPIAFTAETWSLGETLPLGNILGLLALSVVFISMFTYYQYHKQAGRGHLWTFLKRVVSTYVLSFLIVAVIMTLIQRAPWETEWLLAFKRVVIVTFPSSLSAVIADTLR
ncbi:MAG: DUF2391 family protein [Nanoarchaeota archaeon]|nr:DUF2391 family protein [Nanoarchaeota archaeon]